MKHLWGDRRTFLATIAIIGLLYTMNKEGSQKDYALEIVSLAGGIGFINAWEKKKRAND